MRLCLLWGLLALGCGGAPAGPGDAGGLPEGAFWCAVDHEAWCPLGSTCLPSGGCWNAEATGARDNDAGCNPVACQSLEDSALYGTGGSCAGWCAGACQAACSGNVVVEREALAKASGESCAPCQY